jgi:hypothetical protein
METLIIINSILLAINLYFIKDFHSDFKKIVGRVGDLEEKHGRLEEKVKGVNLFFDRIFRKRASPTKE